MTQSQSDPRNYWQRVAQLLISQFQITQFPRTLTRAHESNTSRAEVSNRIRNFTLIINLCSERSHTVSKIYGNCLHKDTHNRRAEILNWKQNHSDKRSALNTNNSGCSVNTCWSQPSFLSLSCCSRFSNFQLQTFLVSVYSSRNSLSVNRNICIFTCWAFSLLASSSETPTNPNDARTPKDDL